MKKNNLILVFVLCSLALAQTPKIEPALVLEGHTGANPTNIAVSPDGKTILSSGEDGKTIIWEAKTSRVLDTLLGVWESVFSPDGRTFVSSGSDTRFWDLKTRKVIKILNQPAGIKAFSPDGKILAVGSYNQSVIRLWNVSTGKLIKTLSGYKGSIFSLEFSPDGRSLASGGTERLIRIWNIASGKVSKVLQGALYSVYMIKFSPDGRNLASTSYGYGLSAYVWDDVLLWDISRGQIINRLGVGSSVLFSPNGQNIAIGGYTSYTGIGNADKLLETVIVNLVSKKITKKFFDGYLLNFSSDGRSLRFESESRVYDLDISSGKSVSLVNTQGNHTVAVRSINFSSSGQFLATSSNYGIILWDTLTGKKVKSLYKYNYPITHSLVFSQDDTKLASGTNGQLCLWDIANEKPMCFSGDSGFIHSIMFSLDNQIIITGNSDSSVKFWNITDGKLLKTLKGHQRAVRGIALSSDGRTIVSGSQDNTIKFWNYESGELLKTLTDHKDWVNSVAISPDDKLLVSASRDKTIKVWDFESGELIRTLTGHSENVKSISIHPSGQILASGSEDNTIRLWDIQSGKEITRLSGNYGMVNDVKFSPDGNKLATGSFDTARIYDLTEFLKGR
jgi:WD40 repeat protein